MARVFSQKHSSTYVGNGGIYSVGKDRVYQKLQSGKTKCFVGFSREGLTRETFAKTRDTRKNQLSPSCPNSLHSSHVQGTCITSREAYSRATHENSFSLQLALSLHTLFLSHTTLTNKTHMKSGYIRLNIITIKFGTE